MTSDEVDDWSSQRAREAWSAGFAKTIELDPVVVPAILGAVAFSLWRSYPGAVFLRGDTASGKTAIMRQVIELANLKNPDEKIASFAGSTLQGLMRQGAFVIDDFYADGPAAQRKAESRLAEIARAAYNQTSRFTDSGELRTPPVTLISGELPVRGSAAHRMLVLELTPVAAIDVAESSKSAAHAGRRLIGERYASWVSELDDDAVVDEYEDFWPDFETPQLAASAFGVQLLNRFLESHGGPRVELDAEVFGLVDEDDELPDVLRTLVSVVVEAVWVEGSHRLVGGGGEGSGSVLGRIDGNKISLVPSQVMSLLVPAQSAGLAPVMTTMGLASALEAHGVLNRDVAGSSRTVTRRLEGVVARVWETEGLFVDEDLAKLREGFKLLESL